MNCPKCGAIINKGAMFCQNCRALQASEMNNAKSGRNKKTALTIIISALLLLLIAYTVVTIYLLANLQKRYDRLISKAEKYVLETE